MNVSPFTKPLYEGVPLKVAAVVPSYVLLFPVTPVIVKATVVMLPVKLGCVNV